MKKIILLALLFLLMVPTASALSCNFNIEKKGVVINLIPILSGDINQYRFKIQDHNGNVQIETPWIDYAESQTLSINLEANWYIIIIEAKDVSGNIKSTQKETNAKNFEEEIKEIETIEIIGEKNIFTDMPVISEIYTFVVDLSLFIKIIFLLAIATILAIFIIHLNENKPKKVRVYRIRS